MVKPINWALLTHRIRYVLRGARTIEALRFSEQKNAALLKAIPDGIFLVDSAGLDRPLLQPRRRTAACARRGRANRSLFDLLPAPKRGHAMDCLMPRCVASRRRSNSRWRARAGSSPLRMPLSAQFAGGQVLDHRPRYYRTQGDQARIHRLAYFDGLTGLPNREWIHDYLAQSLTEARLLNRSLALLYVDLDQFKRINDTLGHETGDALLRQVADGCEGWTGSGVRSRDAADQALSRRGFERIRGHLARVGGDEFIVVLTGTHRRRTGASRRRSRSCRSRVPFRQESYEFVVTPSIGIAMYPEHGGDAQSLLKNADGAMYEAKSSGRNQLRVYDGTMNVARPEAAVAGDGAAAGGGGFEPGDLLPAEIRDAVGLKLTGGRGAVALVPPRARPDPDRRFHRGGRGDRA